ncbi:MAG TPA: type III-B CRISPR module-associated protein Cmr5 [Spirochaetota bacterium]|nr:type III-B CRISPR module-associated protein Cmr5 [Spirochaetota bacterium]
MRTLGQKRAEFSLRKITGIKINKEFTSLANSAPSMILQNGLGLTAAFWKQKSNGTREDRYASLLEWVREWLSECKILKSTDVGSFFISLSECEQMKYLEAQKETLALLEWVKRYANGFSTEKKMENER